MAHLTLKEVNKKVAFFAFSPLSFKNKFFKDNAAMNRRAYKWNEKDMVKWPSCL